MFKHHDGNKYGEIWLIYTGQRRAFCTHCRVDKVGSRDSLKAVKKKKKNTVSLSRVEPRFLDVQPAT